MLFAPFSVLPVAVDLIRQHLFRVAAKPIPVVLHDCEEFFMGSFVIGIKAELVNECISLNYADGQFCAKLNFRLLLAAHNRPDVGLA